MTVLDHSLDDDAKALIAHGETEGVVKRLSITLGWSRRQVFDHFAAFMENDDEAPLTPVAPIDLKPKRKRARKVLAEAHA